MRDHEVIAVVAHDPSEHNALQVFAMQNQPKGYHEERDGFSLLPKAYLTDPNKEKPNQHFPKDETSHCVIAKTGKSHYGDISDSHWKCLGIK